MNITRPLSFAAASVLTASLAFTAAPAIASGGSDDRVIRTGSCSGSADWKLKVKTDDGKLEVEGEVDSNTSGQKWAWKIRTPVRWPPRAPRRRAAAVARSPLERKIADKSGTDTVVFKAKYAGQTCKGTIAFG